MATLAAAPKLTFRPSASAGWIWLVIVGVLVLLPSVAAALSVSRMPWLSALVLIPGLVLSVPLFALAAWFPTMRYELDDHALTCRYGPVLRYRIPYDSIRSITRRNLQVSVWSSLRMPGLALFSVPYTDAGRVRMCATRAADRIVLIDTGETRYGITPADEDAFLAQLRSRLP